MNTTRVIDNPPIEDENLLSTNMFIPNMKNDKNLTNYEKQQFKQFMESKKKDKKEEYLNTNIIKKNKDNLIKVENVYVVDIDSRARDKDLYPYHSQFEIPLGKTFYNIKTIELISTSIPNTDQVITNTPENIRNNRISWTNMEDRDLGYRRNVQLLVSGDWVIIPITNHQLDRNLDEQIFITIFNSTSVPNVDGKRMVEIIDEDNIRIPFIGGITSTSSADVDIGLPIYRVDLTPGNYTASSIVVEMQKQMNLIKRRGGIGEYHYFTVNVNLDTDIITFSSYETVQLIQNPIECITGSGILTVNSTGHGFKKDDYVLIINSKNVGGIPADLINQLHLITDATPNYFQFEVNDRASSSSDASGGTTVKSGKPSEFRLLFDTTKSLIFNNIGFPEEDSSQYLNTGSSTSLTTKVLDITQLNQLGEYIRFTCPSHGLESSSSYTITSLTTGSNVIATTSIFHELGDEEVAFIYYPNSIPALNSYFSIVATSNNTFRIKNLTISSNPGGSGVLKKNGDSIKILNLKTTPDITTKEYPIENVTNDTFDILAGETSIQNDTVLSTKISTKQLFINHPLHGFNEIIDIQSFSPVITLITTKFAHNLNGKYYTNIDRQNGSAPNTADIIFLTPHLLSDNQAVYIKNSTNTKSIDGGPYYIQVVSPTIIRIPFIGGTDIGTCDVITGDTVVFSETNSTPNIELDSLGNVLYNIDVINSTQFKITTGYQIITPGTKGRLGRKNKIDLHRVVSSVSGSSEFAGIPISSINNSYYKIANLVDENNYMIRLGNFPTETISAGGKEITVSSENHGYRTFQSNTFNGEQDGILYKSISLEGENYLFLISPNLQTVFSPGNEGLGDIFAKLLLNESPGIVIFDSFISAPKMFNPPLSELKTIKLSIVRRDGILFNFNNIDFSISLKITEIVDMLIDTAISSRTGTSDLY